MPGYRAHAVGGVAAFGLLYWVSSFYFSPSLPTILQWLSVAVLGALFPDVDVKSKGQGIFYKMMLICLVLLLWRRQMQLFVMASFVALLPVLVRHRGLFHRAWFLVAVPFGVAIAAGSSFPAYKESFVLVAGFFVAGALSHILLDRIF